MEEDQQTYVGRNTDWVFAIGNQGSITSSIGYVADSVGKAPKASNAAQRVLELIPTLAGINAAAR